MAVHLIFSRIALALGLMAAVSAQAAAVNDTCKLSTAAGLCSAAGPYW